jgi:arylsulfatase A-like enzyme
MKSRIHKPLYLSALAIVFVLILVLLILHLRNLHSIDSGAFDRSAQELITRSGDVLRRASPNYQRQVLSSLPPNPYNGAFYRFDDRLNEAEITEKPLVNSPDDFSGVAFGYEFNGKDRSGLVSGLGKMQLQVQNGIAKIQPIRGDYFTNETPIGLPVRDIREVFISARASKNTRIILAWRNDRGNYRNLTPAQQDRLWHRHVSIDLIGDQRFHPYLINLEDLVRSSLNSEKKIESIFLRPSSTDDVTVEIDFMRFLTPFAKYLRKSNGVTYEVIGNEMRQVLYMLPTQTLEYSLQIPEKSPVFSFGNATLFDDKPVEFQISIKEGIQITQLYSKNLSNSNQWQDTSLDLSRWSGKKVHIAIRASGSSNTVAFWSNPLISSEANKPLSVIIVLEDALRPDHLSINGYKLPTSPVKDKLLREQGIIFDTAISQACWTRPSIPSLMTSLLPSVTGVWRFSDMLQDEYLTIAEIMRSQGFVTASFVQNPNAGPWAGMHQGFSQILDSATIGASAESILGDRLKSWLTSHNRQNFFLYLHILNPAGRYDPPAPYNNWYKESQTKGKPVKRGYMDADSVKQPTDMSRRLLYDGQIRYNDSLLPNLLDTLKESNIFQNTLLIFLSDHGEYLGEHGLWSHREPGYFQGVHVQFSLVYPARFKESRRISETVQLIDVMPTILEIAQVDTSKLAMQGDSLVGLIEGQRPSYWKDRIVVSEEPDRTSPAREGILSCGSLFYRNWQLISSRSLFKGARDLPSVLRLAAFDFKKDPVEAQLNLSLFVDLPLKYRLSEVLKGLQATDIEAWSKFTEEGQNRILKSDPKTMDHLRSLGYIK